MKINPVVVILFSILLFGFSSFKNSPKSVPLEAVLIVGNTENGTTSSIKEMNTLALIFENRGIKVTKFYDKNTDWEAIKKAAKTASFFVYSGHGSTMGINGGSGGLCLIEMITAKQMIEELRLKKNAVVLFKYVCRGAGSSADDFNDIGIEEATTRVSDYAQPFFTIGAACYYANNYYGGIDYVLKNFLEGMTFEECYLENTHGDYNCREILKPFIFDPNKKIAIASNQQVGMATHCVIKNGKTICKKIPSRKSYDIAFVGNPDLTIEDLTGLK
jgi:hypothetical protein